MFQSTRPRGARQYQLVRSANCSRFNPRAHAGRDGFLLRTQRSASKFQSTRPRGARRQCCFWHRAACRFNPRAHAGRDNSGGEVSAGRDGFNPRAHAGRDHEGTGIYGPHKSFNPRAHAGRDLSITHPLKVFYVSIHAPTRGATPLGQLRDRSGVFQSTRPRGARRNTAWAVALMLLFQSTRPRGARPQ